MEQTLDSPTALSPQRKAIRAETTRWSLILEAAESDPEQARAAMTTLAEQYLTAMYAYVRHQSGNAQDAEDMVHSFYLERLPGLLNAAKEEKGSFRGLLKRGLDWWLIECRRSETAQKRDVRRKSPLPAEGEQFYAEMTADGLSPEMVWDLSWASLLLSKVMDEMAEEVPERERKVLQYIRESAERAEDVTRDELATLAGITPNAVSQVRRKLRDRLRRKALDYCRSVQEFQEESVYFLELLGVEPER